MQRTNDPVTDSGNLSGRKRHICRCHHLRGSKLYGAAVADDEQNRPLSRFRIGGSFRSDRFAPWNYRVRIVRFVSGSLAAIPLVAPTLLALADRLSSETECLRRPRAAEFSRPKRRSRCAVIDAADGLRSMPSAAPRSPQFNRRWPAVSRYQSNGASWVATITLLVLKWSSKLSEPNSRPTPLSSTPPQGEAGSRR